MSFRIPLFTTSFGPEEEEAVLGVVRSGWLTMGDRVRELEERFSGELAGVHALAVTNCTAGLHLAYEALGIGAGDEVIVPSITFIATANTVRAAGATPVFADITSLGDPCVDPDDVERRITPRTKAICVVHFAGFPCDMGRINAIARQHNLAVIEDCAHALFSSLDGRRLGTFGTISAFSFFSNKNITCGEGGMVATSDGDLAKACSLRRSHGMTTLTLDRHHGRAISYDVACPGHNYRLDEIRAALALAQLDRLPRFLAARRELRAEYQAALSDIIGLIVPDFGHRSDDVGIHIMPTVLPAEADRVAVIQALRERGIQTSIHYPAIHRFTGYRGSAGPLERSEEFASRELTLPFYPGMSAEDVGYVANALREVLT